MVNMEQIISKIESLRYDIETGIEVDVIKISVRLIEIRSNIEQLRQPAVVGRSEQLVCPFCSSENVDAEFNHYNFCRNCNHDWAN